MDDNRERMITKSANIDNDEDKNSYNDNIMEKSGSFNPCQEINKIN